MSAILKGYLGTDPEIRLPESAPSPRLGTTPSPRCTTLRRGSQVRRFHVLSLATHENNRTTWHRLAVWSSHQLCHRNIRFAGKGDLVQVKGRPETFRLTTDDGTNHEMHRVIVERFRVLRRNPKRLPPEIPWHHEASPSRGGSRLPRRGRAQAWGARPRAGG